MAPTPPRTPYAPKTRHDYTPIRVKIQGVVDFYEAEEGRATGLGIPVFFVTRVRRYL